MNGFIHIRKILIPRSELDQVGAFLRGMGHKHVEGVALLAGRESDDVFTVTRAVIPAQKSYRLEAGLLYAVEGEELHRINVWLHTNRLTLIAQVHSHPQEAYHSDTDDRYPIVDTNGSISIVVPDFAKVADITADWVVYRLIPGIGWKELHNSEIRELIQLT